MDGADGGAAALDLHQGQPDRHRGVGLTLRSDTFWFSLQFEVEDLPSAWGCIGSADQIQNG